MSVRDESSQISSWLYATMNADSALVAATGTGRFYLDRMPDGGQFPCVIFTKTGTPEHMLGFASEPIWLEGRWIIKAVKPATENQELEAAANRIVTLFNKRMEATATARFWATRTGAWQRSYTQDRIVYQELGIMALIRCQII